MASDKQFEGTCVHGGKPRRAQDNNTFLKKVELTLCIGVIGGIERFGLVLVEPKTNTLRVITCKYSLRHSRNEVASGGGDEWGSAQFEPHRSVNAKCERQQQK